MTHVPVINAHRYAIIHDENASWYALSAIKCIIFLPYRAKMHSRHPKKPAQDVLSTAKRMFYARNTDNETVVDTNSMPAFDKQPLTQRTVTSNSEVSDDRQLQLCILCTILLLYNNPKSHK